MEPALVFALAEVESHFNPQAVSPVGAVGIMQIMPATGDWIAGLLGMNNYKEKDLLDPVVNLRFGAYYLAYLKSLFSEEWQVVVAYNAGETVVRSWIAEGVTPESIPYPETSAYLIKVKRALSRYRSKKYAGFD